MAKKRVYSYGSETLIEAQLPKALKDAMGMCGWNAFGIYELVNRILQAEKRAAKNAATSTRGDR